MHHCNAIGTIKCFVKCIENILATARGLNISPFPRKTCKMKILCKGQSNHSKDNQTTILCYCTASYGEDYLNCSSRGSGFLAWMEYKEPGRYRKPPRVLSSLKLKCSTNLVSPYGQHSEEKDRRTLVISSFLIWQKRLTSAPLSLFLCKVHFYTTFALLWHQRHPMAQENCPGLNLSSQRTFRKWNPKVKHDVTLREHFLELPS